MLNERQFKHLYHETPVSNRESIRQHGLRPGPGVQFHTGTQAPPGTYLSPPGRSEYGSSIVGHDGPWFGMDRWRVHAEGLDVRPDPTQPNGAFYTPDHIPPERLRLAKKAHPDWERHI